MKSRVYNFGAGPATLPESILLDVQAELLNWHEMGLSILEIGHRTPEFQYLLEDAEADLRDLLAIPVNYHVLFLGGSARAQFATIPLNLIQSSQKAGYLLSGVWSEMAYQEALKLKLKQAYCVAQATGCAPSPADFQWQDDTAYLYYTPNETIQGVRFPYIPKSDGIPKVADMTSCLLGEPINVSDFGLIFAGSQKNIAPAGLTIVIVRDDLIKHLPETPIPTMLDFRTHVQHRSLYATPPVFNCYMASKMFKWIKAQGGVDALSAINVQKAEKLYDYIDASGFYQAPVPLTSRSVMNVCFALTRPELEEDFLKQSIAQGLYALKGHRLVGGMRASLYNAMPMDGVDALISFMQVFAEDHRA